MDFKTYLSYFSEAINTERPAAPYDDPDYLEYARLNWSRTNRWLKKGELDQGLRETILAVEEPQEWILITEPWCGDAAHSVPFIAMAAALNPAISLRIELRDQPPFSIEQYLTNGGKSIPKLIIRNRQGEDLAVWGPRPEAAQEQFEQLKTMGKTFDEQKEVLQRWYNADKGQSIQQELSTMIRLVL